MVIKSEKNDNNASDGGFSDGSADPAVVSIVNKPRRSGGTLTNKKSLINGLTIAEQDPTNYRPKARKKGKQAEKKVASSEALLKKK